VKVLIADRIAAEGVEALRAHAEVDVKLDLSRDELVSIIGDYDALMVRSGTKVSREVIEAGKRLQAIGRAGVGVDNIDVEAATGRGIVVVNAPTGNTVSAAEHTIAMMLAMARRIPQANAVLKSGEWRRQDFVGVEVRNKTLGIAGLGNVGTEVARRAKGLEMRVIAHDPFVSVEYAGALGVELVSLDELLKKSDFITVHTTMTKATRGLVGAKELAKVKPTVQFINCARGGIIDEQALFEALKAGKVAGAAIDVFSTEPATDNILLESDKVIVTPHLGASTAEAQTQVATDAAEQVIAVLRGQRPRYAVNAPFIPPEILAEVEPFIGVSKHIGRLLSQLSEGQISNISVKYEGEIANHDTTVLKAAIIGGLLEAISEERITMVNANLVAQRRGLKITEQKDTACANYGNLVTVEVATSAGAITVAGTVMRGEPHIVRVDNYWVDLAPSGGYFILSDHKDRPGLIGTVGTVLGEFDINISSMQVSRLEPRGRALMVLSLDEPISEEQRQQLLAIPDVYTIKPVKL
jgi:D-3-phosphoglycerate dehydrogenase